MTGLPGGDSVSFDDARRITNERIQKLNHCIEVLGPTPADGALRDVRKAWERASVFLTEALRLDLANTKAVTHLRSRMQLNLLRTATDPNSSGLNTGFSEVVAMLGVGWPDFCNAVVQDLQRSGGYR